MEKNKYWFFGSKLNTALLLILIILMVIALRWMSQNREMYLPTVQEQTYDLGFFKSQIQKLPYAEIRQVTVNGNTYFAFNNLAPGSGLYIYSSTGTQIDSCAGAIPNAVYSELCTNVISNYGSSKVVFLSAEAPGNTLKKSIDTYHIMN